MHFNFHLSGDESAEQTRRIANAVLALGGLLTPAKSTSVGEITVGVKIDTTNATAALDKLAEHPGAKWVEEDAVTANAGESPNGGLRRSTVSPETGIEIPRERMSANEVKELISSPSVTITEITERTREGMRAAGIENPSPVIPPAPPVNAAEFDSKGLPWDERIHSGSRKFNADGSWRYRKNVPDETKLAVEGELRHFIGGMLAESITPPVPPAPPAPVVPINIDALNAAIPTMTAEQMRDAVIQPPTIIPPAPPTTAARTYPDVVNLIMSRKITPETYVAILGSDLPTFAATCKTDPNAASVAFDALDRASRT